MPDTLLPPTRKISGAAQWLADALRWLRHNFTRDNLIQALKTLAAVGPLTILIWIYAEREGIHPEPDVSISIEVRCSDPHRLVSLQKPYPDKVVVADLAGPPNMLDAVVERLERSSGDVPAVQILIDPTLRPNMVHEIDTAAALANNPTFRGITVSNCQPPKLDVRVDELEDRDVEVQAPPSTTNLVGPPVFTPRTVKVRGPKDAIEDLEKDHKLIAVADLGSFDAMNVPGPHDFPIVRIRPLDDPNLSFSPPGVEAAVSVRESDVPGEILSVPIWVTGPPEVVAEYRVHFLDPENGVLKNVKVTGPADKIATVNQFEFQPKPHAELAIQNDDEAGKPLSRQVIIDLPLGLHLTDEISQHPVQFTLEKIKTGGND